MAAMNGGSGGTGWLAAAGVLALLLLGLGALPWDRPGTPWRPANVVAEQEARRHWDADLVERGRDFRSLGYQRALLRKGTIGLLLVLALGLGVHRALRHLPFGNTIAGATLALLAVLLILDLAGIPFGLAGLRAARAYGLSRQSVGFWMADHLKGLGLSLLLSAVVGAVLFFLLQRFPRTWPLPATLLAGVGGVVLTLIVPLVVDPLFNTFAPLQDAALKARFLDLARRGGMPAREVLVSDASRRTSAVNAYFTGFGPTRRIVVYDTLVQKLSPAEAGLVLAHEAGHWKLGHITKGLLLGTLGTALGLVAAALLLAAVFRRGMFGLQGPLDPAAAPLLLLLYWAGTFAALPVENAVSRRYEREADRYALELTGDAGAQVAAEVSLCRTNLADVSPPPFIRMLYHTHPGPLERIAEAEAWGRAHPPSPEGGR